MVRVPVPGRTPPYGLAYVDLDDGPRILAHVADDVADHGTVDGSPVERVAPGTRMRVSGSTDLGDVQVETVSGTVSWARLAAGGDGST